MSRLNENTRAILYYVLIFFTICVFTYLCFVFILMEFNPFKWQLSKRMLCVIAVTCQSYFFILLNRLPY